MMFVMKVVESKTGQRNEGVLFMNLEFSQPFLG